MIDILKIGKDARESKKLYADTIDASIGMFYDDQHNVGGFPSVFRVLKSFSPEQMLPYNSVDGGKEFQQKVSSWLFGPYEQTIKDAMHPYVCATPGGSGAVSSTFVMYGSHDEALLVPDIRWQYDRFAKPRFIPLEAYAMFDGKHFNLHDFEKKIETLCQKQKRLIVVINDPCHNPTGYTLSIDEWEKIIAILNRFSNREIIFLYDVAYIDYSLEKDSRLKLSYLPKLGKHVLTVVAFSGSKTFGAYGLRLGAAVGLSTDENKVKEFQQKMYGYACGTWSSISTPSVELVKAMMKDENRSEFLVDLAKARKTIAERGAMFHQQAAAAGLVTAPYVNGFYSFVYCTNPIDAYEKLAAHRIFVVPMDTGIRLALCGLTVKEIDGLALRMKTLANL